MRPLQENLKRLGGWPVLEGDRWNDGDFTWKDSVYRFRRLGYSVDYFIDFGVSVDLKNNSRRLIDVSTCKLILNCKIQNKRRQKTVEKYAKRRQSVDREDFPLLLSAKRNDNLQSINARANR